MATFLLALAIALLAGYLVVAVALLRVYGVRVPVDELHRVDAGPGWQLALHRLRPAAGVERRATPVILAHGIAMSHRFWHLTGSISLARALSRRGHDVWIVEYRGYGDSVSGGGAQAWDFSLDHHALEDAPEVIEYVCRTTGAERVDWVGHSMGGMVLYGYVQGHGTGRLRRVVTVGSPVRMGRRATHLWAPRPLLGLLVRGWRFPLHSIARWTLPFTVFFPRAFLRPFYNVDIVRPGEIAALFAWGVGSLSNRVLRQFAGWQRRGEMPLEDGGRRIEDGPAAIDVPFLVIAGAGDRLVPPRAARPAYERSPSRDKAWRVFGSEGDPAPPLGHVDLIASASGQRWVAPVIADWLERGGD